MMVDADLAAEKEKLDGTQEERLRLRGNAEVGGTSSDI